MKIHLFIFFLLILASCSKLTENQKNLLDKKWYSTRETFVEFKSDMTYLIHFEDSIKKYQFEFVEDHVLKIKGEKETFSPTQFNIKDSILFFVPYESSKRKGDMTDTSFFHLNPKYEFWQTRQLFYFGKIINDEGKPLPFIYFEF